MILKSILSPVPPRCSQLKFRAYFIRSFRHSFIYIRDAFSIAISSHKTYSLIRLALLLSWPILVSREPSVSQLRPTLMRSLLCGIVAQRFFLVRSSTRLELISGQLGAFSPRWPSVDLYLWETLRSIKSSKSSRSLALPTSKTGPKLSSFQTSKQHSQNGRVSLFMSTPRTLMKLAWTYSMGWSLSILTSVFLLAWPFCTPTSTLLIKANCLFSTEQNQT